MISVLRKYIFLTTSVFCWLSTGVLTLKIVSLDVPDRVAPGQGTALTCHYDLEGEDLFNIKWYKDDVEFFRFMVHDNPQKKMFFSVPGVNVDNERSDSSTVYIRDVKSSTTGVYQCEVSTEAPFFRTVVAKKFMFVEEFSGPISSGQYEVDRSAINMLLIAVIFLLQCKYHTVA